MLTFPNLLNIARYMSYCMGEGYMDKRRYAEDEAVERRSFRFQQMSDLATRRSLENAFLAPPAQNTPTPLARFFAPLQALIQPTQVFIQTTLQALQQLGNKLQQRVQQAVQTMAAPLKAATDALVGQLLSFFMGRKTNREEERRLRDQDDFKDSDLFTRYVVVETNTAGGGGQSAS